MRAKFAHGYVMLELHHTEFMRLLAAVRAAANSSPNARLASSAEALSAEFSAILDSALEQSTNQPQGDK